MKRFHLLPFCAAVALASCSMAGDAMAVQPQGWNDFSSRVVQIMTQVRNPGGAVVSATSACPDPVHDIAIGGDCNAGDDASLFSTRLVTAAGATGYTCSFKQSEGNPSPVVVSVLCVINAR